MVATRRHGQKKNSGDCCYVVGQPSGERWTKRGAPLAKYDAVATKTQSTNTSDPPEPKCKSWEKKEENLGV